MIRGISLDLMTSTLKSIQETLLLLCKSNGILSTSWKNALIHFMIHTYVVVNLLLAFAGFDGLDR
jgi:hypothetical protein